jgi:uncharacterized protein
MPDLSSFAPGTLCWWDLATTNPAGARGFYHELFGWSWRSLSGIEPDAYIFAAKRDIPVAGIYQQSQEHRAAGLGPAWVPYVAAADADATCKQARALGAKLVVPPFDVLDQGRAALLRDPTGALVALWQARGHSGAAVTGEPGSVAWAELVADDVDGAGRFYARLFGWQAKAERLGGHQVTLFLRSGRGGEPVASLRGRGAAGNTVPPEAAPYWLVHLAVADVDATLARLRELGGSVASASSEALGLGRRALARDPQGALFALLAAAPRATGE